MLAMRLWKISATLFVSMILAMVMLAALWFYLPEWFSWVQDGADMLEDGVAAIPLPEKINNLVRIYASDDKIVLLIFTIIARVMLAFVGKAFTAVMPKPKVKVAEEGILGQIGSTISTLFLAFVIAILMVSAIALFWEAGLHYMLNASDWVEDKLAHLPIGGRWRSGVRFVVSDDKILLLFFTIIARALIVVFATSFGSAWRSVTGSGREKLVRT
ncbi:hypothetical protein [uncultured Maricaulis sp.]|uniref:hypothetical protein n=1 Tax=uncultured Maricaulis sp. TaxID=174710 RepID=UPI0030D9C3B2|tara:strand:+ start:23575 stop:24219 length:645 start_codon:yes stop_codon:yes gene_type:complete